MSLCLQTRHVSEMDVQLIHRMFTLGSLIRLLERESMQRKRASWRHDAHSTSDHATANGPHIKSHEIGGVAGKSSGVGGNALVCRLRT